MPVARPCVDGVHTVLYALFSGDGTLDAGAMRAQTQAVRDSGVKGITVLGLATEVQKLSPAEQRHLIEIVAPETGDLPLSVTLTGGSVTAQREMARVALDHGARWLILQPPAVGTYPGATYLEFFLAVAEGFDLRVAVQNAPQYLGRGLSRDDILLLRDRNPNFDVIKAEAPSVDLARLAQAAGDRIDILNGRGGLELLDCLRAGACGFILAPDIADRAQQAMALWQAGRTQEAEAEYAAILPAITFCMQSIEHLICYGKRLFAARAELTIHDRAPAQIPTDFGLAAVDRYARVLGPI